MCDYTKGNLNAQSELITIVVPIYNVEEYLAECVESLINQSYYNIEILLIDDGSKDASSEIADECANKDGRVVVFHKKNGGLSDARNYGIDRAIGKYITFVDSDDYVSKNFIETLYTNLIKYNADVSGCVYKRTILRSFKGERKDDKRDTEIMVWDSEMAIKKMLRQENGFTTSACALLYKIDFFNDIRYPKGAYFEDLGTTYKILHKIRKIVRTSECLYYYYTRAGSISSSKFQPKYMDQIKFAKDIQSFIAKYYPALKKDADARLVGVCFNTYMTFEKQQIAEYREEIRLLREIIVLYRKSLILSQGINTKVRLACLLSYFGMPVCSYVYRKFSVKGT